MCICVLMCVFVCVYMCYKAHHLFCPFFLRLCALKSGKMNTNFVDLNYVTKDSCQINKNNTIFFTNS